MWPVPPPDLEVKQALVDQAKLKEGVWIDIDPTCFRLLCTRVDIIA